MNEAKERIMDVVGTGYNNELKECKCLPPTASITMKATALGIQAKLSNLEGDRGQSMLMTILNKTI
jgi:hypothetical protein